METGRESERKRERERERERREREISLITDMKSKEDIHIRYNPMELLAI